MKLHAKLSCSGSEKWLNCPGSVKAEESYVAIYGEGKSSKYADEGTAAHTLGEQCLVKGHDPVFYKGQMIGSFKVDDEMIEAVSQYVEFVRSKQGERFVELKISLDQIIENGFGTVDAVVIQDQDLHIFDYKHGKGVKVSSERNTQLMLYALGVCRTRGFEQIHLHIVQPRINNFCSYTLSYNDLYTFGEEVKIKAAMALSNNAKRIAGEKQCRWCKARSTCEEANSIVIQVSGFQILETEEIKFILDNESFILDQIKAVKEHAIQNPPEGYKVVRAKTHRKWIDEQKVIDLLGKDVAVKVIEKVITPAQVEKLKIKPEGINELWYSPEGEPVLVRDDDKRSAISEEFKQILN